MSQMDKDPVWYPLTAVQQGIYLECVAKPDSLPYNIPAVCELPKGVDGARFAEAAKAVALRHPVLFAVVGTPEGVPSMTLGSFPVTVEERQVKDRIAARREFLRPFDLEKGPLFRFALHHTPEGEEFLLDVHHLIFDGTSLRLFVRQVAAAYETGVLPEEELLMPAFAAEEAALGESAGEREAEAFFRKRLEGADCDAKPVPDAVTLPAANGTGLVRLLLGDDLTPEGTAAFAKGMGVTENALFLGAFAYTLAKCNGTDHSYFVTAYHGRQERALEAAVGMFVRTLPMYCAFKEEWSPRELISHFHEDFYRAKQNRRIPFGKLAEDYGANTDVSFIYQSELLNDVDTAQGRIRVIMGEDRESVAPLEVMLLRTGSGFEVKVFYSRADYTEAFALGFARLFRTVLAGLMQAKTLGEIDLADGDAKAFLETVNATETDYDREKTVVAQFREQAKKTPDRVCVVYEGERYTYGQTDRLTDALAAELRRRGVGKEKIVGILVPRCAYMPICALGVLKAGGAYLPLDPTYPPERLNLMLQDSGAMLLISDPELNGIISEQFRGDRILTGAISTLPPCTERLPEPAPEDLFVVLYTSGSTGLPKGVMYEHSNAMVTTAWVREYFSMDESAKATAYASYGFDANVFDTYPALTCGGELHIISEELRLDFPALREYFNKNGITHTVMTTQVGRQFSRMPGLTTLRHLSVAGEKLTPPPVPEGFTLYNLYGPSEGSVVTSAFPVRAAYRDVPIGSPVGDLKIYVTDGQGRLLPPGAVGELWIAGPHVTRGYLNRPEKTAEAYGENPFPHPRGYERIYRTGDVVRLLHDGKLQFVGRRDGQVKVRGFRIELTEVEEVIRRFPGITDATVAAFDDPAGGKLLAAYVVAEAPVEEKALAAFIREEKPPYMVPAVVMQIDRIPLNQNQKVNKKALPRPERKTEDLTPPENRLQQRIFDCAKEVLGHGALGIDTDLYEAGLTSIGAVRLNAALADAFGVPLKIAQLRENSTVKRLAQLLQNAAPAAAYGVQEDYPVTETQKGIFVECMAAPDTTVYNIPALFRLDPRVELTRLVSAVGEAINAHPYVKATLFSDGEGDIRAKRQDTAPPQVELVSCAALPEPLVRPFVLLGQPLYRAAVYDTANGAYLFLDFHHILFDGTSEEILLRDIDLAYGGSPVPTETYTGFEAALEEEAARRSSAYEKAKRYYDTLLAGRETETLPPKAPESDAGGVGRQSRRCRLDAGALRDYCAAHRITENGFFNGVLGFVLNRFKNSEEVVYTTVYHGRNDSRLANAVTMLVKTLPVVAELQGETPVSEYLTGIQKQLLESMSSDIYSFGEISRAYGVRADVIFVYQGESFAWDTIAGKPAELLPLESETAKSPLSVNVFLREGSYTFTAEYRREQLCGDMVSSLLASMERCAEEFLHCALLKEVSILSPEGEAQIRQMNRTDAPYEQVPITTLLERYGAEEPSRVAVTAGEESMTFAELQSNICRIARGLIALGIGRDTIVGLLVDRTLAIPLGEFGILKAGGAYLPMLPSYPDDRIDFCLRDAESPVVVTTEAILAARPELFSPEKPYRAVTLEQLLREPEDSDPGVEIPMDSLAYCIYTSGSTGKPKGVMIEHKNLTNHVLTNFNAGLFRGEDPVRDVLAVVSIAFDASGCDTALPLSYGAAVHYASEEEIHDPVQLMKLMSRYRVEGLTSTPSFGASLAGMPGVEDALRNMKYVILGGEAFPAPLVAELKRLAPNMRILNCYGPTECTIGSSTKELEVGTHITIGAPGGNTRYYIVDKNGHIQPPYACGELIIGGDCVGRGYVKLPDKTAAVFFTMEGEPAYHSGDQGRMNRDGEIEFFGRMDNQVKLRGFRVELDEIENVMLTYAGIRQTKVIVRNNGSEDYLAGFFTADGQVELEKLTEHLRSKLTYYMVPAVLMQLERMPMTPNGKIDKNALPETQQTASRKTGRRAPKKSLEQKLCEIFASVLKLEEVYADENFFELGGTSLSASKVTMALMSEGIEIKYGDIFDNPTPESLAQFIEKRDPATAGEASAPSAAEPVSREALRYNLVRYAAEVVRKPLGNVLLTGAVGFLGIHILRELLLSETGKIFCLVRRGSHETPEIRLKTMLIYYFSDSFAQQLRDRVTVLEADITDRGLAEVLAPYPLDTVINCAACVKHFAGDDILERINVHGVENLISICRERELKLIQISTVSVPGMHTKESYENQVRMHENELFVIDDMQNKYGISKYQAELRMLDAIEAGMRGKIIRVGNLMGRHSDGEFQANLETNMFMSGIRGFATMGKYPISHMTDPMRFSPVDCTARAVVLLAGTNDRFTAFNCDNRYGFDEMKIIDSCNRCGIPILPADDEQYYAEYHRALGNEKINSRLNGLAAYDIPDAHAVDTDNLFTTNVLYRIGFSWPLVDDAYLDRAIQSIMSLDYFSDEEPEEEL